MHYIIALLSIALGSIAQMLLKIGVSKTETTDRPLTDIALDMLTNLHLWGGLVAYGLSLILWLVVLQRLSLSVAYPMVSLGYVFTTILAYCFLGETVPPMRIAGLVVILAGVCMVAQS